MWSRCRGTIRCEPSASRRLASVALSENEALRKEGDRSGTRVNAKRAVQVNRRGYSDTNSARARASVDLSGLEAVSRYLRELRIENESSASCFHRDPSVVAWVPFCNSRELDSDGQQSALRESGSWLLRIGSEMHAASKYTCEKEVVAWNRWTRRVSQLARSYPHFATSMEKRSVYPVIAYSTIHPRKPILVS